MPLHIHHCQTDLARRQLCAGIILMLMLTASQRAHTQMPAAAFPIQSSSGQFSVSGLGSAAWPAHVRILANNTNYIVLEPALLAVSCERIRQKLYDLLDITAPWHGKIHLNLRPARSGDDLVTIAVERVPGGWIYIVGLPDLLPRDRYVRAIVHVLLSEAANRAAPTRTAEIPAWLVEGLCAELRATSELELFLSPPNQNVRGLSVRPQMVTALWSDPGELARREFRSRPPLTFEQLSWPENGQLAGQAGGVYRYSALLFLDSLLQLPDGAASLRSFLEQLHRYRNWQLAFFQTFQARFQTPLDVEKWWALQVVYATGRGQFDRWTASESLARLDQALLSNVDLRIEKNALPTPSHATLQTIIREWNLAPQSRVLHHRMAELELMRLRIEPGLLSIVAEYQAAIADYLKKRGLADLQDRTVPGGPVADRISEEALSRLDALDSQRNALRQRADRTRS